MAAAQIPEAASFGRLSPGQWFMLWHCFNPLDLSRLSGLDIPHLQFAHGSFKLNGHHISSLYGIVG